MVAAPSGDAAPIPVSRPRLPGTAALVPYLDEIERNAWYSNFGPLVERLGRRFADHFGLDPGQVLPTASGTASLIAALTAVRRPGFTRCLLPSWTFAATAGACCAARLDPHLCDIDADTWALDPEALARRTDLADVAAVLVTCPFGDPVDTAAWDAFTARTGVPVVIDAAAAFGALDAGALAIGRSLVAVSLHATKTFGIGEGGLLLGADIAAVRRATAAVNFGFYGARSAIVAGINGKLSEYGAAVGHAALDRWIDDRASWQAAQHLYQTRHAAFTHRGALRLTGARWAASTMNWVAADAASAEAAETALAARAIDTRRWWGAGCHRDPAYAAFPRDPLPVTEALAPRCLGLPMFRDLTGAQADRIAVAFANLARTRAAGDHGNQASRSA